MARADLKYIIGFETNDAPVVQATKRLSQLQAQQRTLEKAQKDGVISMAIMRKGQKQLNDEIGRLRAATAQGGKALDQYINKVNASGKAMRRKELAAQQAGYQLQDFIVQIQAGQNPVIAFTQQFSQLAGFFAGPWGAAIGLGVAVLGGLVTALVGTGDAAEDTLEKVADSVKSMKQEIRELQTGLNTEQLALEDQLAAARAREAAALQQYITRRQQLLAQGVDPDDMVDRATGKSLLISAQEETSAALEEYEEYNKQLSILQGQREARAAEERANTELAEAAVKALSGGSGEESAEQKSARELQEYLDKLDVKFHRRAEISLLEGEALVVQKQMNELEDLHNALVEKGLKLGSREYTLAIQSLREAQANELQQYRTNEAKKKALEIARKQREEAKKLTEQEKMVNKLADNIGSSMEEAFVSMVEGTSSVKDAFRDMARDIVKHLYKVLVVQEAIRSFGGALAGSSSSVLSNIGGALSTYGQRASGGTVMSNKPYLVGEKGPELIVPQNRGHVMNADLTSKAMGSGEQVVINQSFNFSANGDDSVKKLIAQAAPQIANLTQKQIMDSRRRGGTLKSTFG